VSTPTVLVTGAGRGIGRATVEGFLAGGWQAVAGVRDVDAARAAFAPHPQLSIVELDVCDAGSILDGTAAAMRIAGGPLASVVPNAGCAVMGSSEDVDLDVVRRMFETNLFGNAAVVQHVLPAMREAGSGVIVCTSSIGARLANPLLGMYHASKYAMTAWAEAMRLELLPFGVRVHVVEPGMVNTDFRPRRPPPGRSRAVRVPMRRCWDSFGPGSAHGGKRLGSAPRTWRPRSSRRPWMRTPVSGSLWGPIRSRCLLPGMSWATRSFRNGRCAFWGCRGA